MAAAPARLQLDAKPFSSFLSRNPISKHTLKVGRISCSAASPSKRYSITLLPGDGIGPEVISVAKNVLNLAASIDGFFYSASFFSFRQFYFDFTPFGVRETVGK